MTSAAAVMTARPSAGIPMPPRVSAIMPTRDRRRFVAQALRYFLRQDYPDTELIVVDDGYDAVDDLMVDDPRIRYIRLDSLHSIGAKRNLACQCASGEIIAHWDDDDWSAPDRLRRQVGAMLEAGADACGLSEVLHYRPLRGDGWLYRGGADGTGAVAGCSIVYRRAVWHENPFPDVSLGEDSAFVGGLASDRVLALTDRSLMVAVIHGHNVSTLPLGTRQWESAGLDEIGRLMGADRAFYSHLRGGRLEPADAPGDPGATAIDVVANFDVVSGYGCTGEYLALSLARAGAAVRAVPLGLSPEGLTEELMAMITRRPAAPPDHPTIYHSWLRPDAEPFDDTQRLFISTMWETSRLPRAWVRWLRQARVAIVPTTFVARACRDSGLDRPVAVVPLGVDPDIYHWQPREEREGLVTLIVAPVDDRDHSRKHTSGAIDAWKRAFAGDGAARLVIKTAYAHHGYVPDDPRITYVDRVDWSRGIAHWYRQADVLLALGNEGFGMPLVEGMSTGLPVVALDAEGQADVCRDAPDLVLAVPAAGLLAQTSHAGEPLGYRSLPDLDAVVDRLRWVDEHRDEAREMGRAASAWATEQRNAWSVGPAVLDVVHGSFGGSGSRRAAPRTLWVTTAGKPCGVAAYTERLRRSLPGARMSATEPRIGAGGVVHIQHEWSIIDDERIERFIAQARAGGTAVVVTEHTVVDRAASWERSASALVAATSAGAARLRARQSDVPVVHIPLGCEAWSFPRKPHRGRTIGFFGFPQAHKGFTRLAAALRHVRGCDVVMFAHSPWPSRPSVADWPADVAVRWEAGWLPLAEVAGELAAAADVLVFHYDEIAHSSASSAVLLGLSTRVPVLTSDTSWFADFGAAVHRAAGPPEAFAAELERLLEDDELRDRTASAAREYCQANSWNRTAARHVALWESLKTT